ncbi:tetratricopeptide repeat protein [Kitasatospora sp. NPDC057223]|uniref:tetratricopeptide repeat protein n=1 Tax=Kitasatospora sp. NPDC057223 TaxID=3346055 RepID=UPI003630B2B7
MSDADRNTADSQPLYVQNVIAVNGFAFGAIGADIHVHGAGGLPLYLLGNWQSPPDTDRDWLRELPSRMLNARRAVVPFTGRQDELDRLREWRDNGGRLGVRWLYGPGGQGKSRLAARFADESAEAGWKVVVAFHGPDADPIEPGSQDLRPDGTAGVLLIVDYADRWLTTNLTWLLKNALLHRSGVTTRVLMLGRTMNELPQLRGILDTYQATVSVQSLAALSPGGEGRGAMFTAARDAFARIYRVDDATMVHPPPALGDAEFGLTLAVHMAALVAVDVRAATIAIGTEPETAIGTGTGAGTEHAAGAATESGPSIELPTDQPGLTMYLLDRERLHWARQYSDGANAAQDGNGFRTPPEVMNRTVYAAVLTGTLARAAGAAVLDRLRVPDAPEVLDDHTSCYPPAEPAADQVMEPLYPDRLAEDFLALTMPGHHFAYPEQPWAAADTSALLERRTAERDPGRAAAPWTARAVTFLLSAAQHWNHLGPQYLHPLLLTDPRLAVDAGSAALTILSGLPDIVPVLEALEAHLPEGRHTDLDVGVAAVTARLTAHRLGLTRDPAERALLHAVLATRQSNAGLAREALDSSVRAVECLRGPAEEDPARHLPGLSGALANLGACRSALRQHAEALAATEEAVLLARRHAAEYPAAEYPDAPQADLARPLSNLVHHLLEADRLAEAVDTAREAVELYDRLSDADADTDGYRPGLARALVNAGIAQFQLGHRADAVETGLAALAVFRDLAAADPDRYEPEFATSLTTVANHLWGMGRGADACGPAAMAVSIRRRLATVNPDAFRPALARALTGLGIYLWAAGRSAEALATSEEAVAHWRELAVVNPSLHEEFLAAALSNLGNRLAAVGRPTAALAATEEAVQIHRGLAASGKAFNRDNLGMALNNLGNRLAAVNRTEDAIKMSHAAVGIYRTLADEHPSAYRSALARALANLASHWAQLGLIRKGLTLTEEAIAIQRELASANPAAFTTDLRRFEANRDTLRSELAD